VSAATFAGVALFVWSRSRWVFVGCGILYASLFVGADRLSPQGHFALAGLLVFAPLLLPLSLFLDSGRAANLDLTSPDGLFPRNFFVLPATAHQLVLPFMLYTTLLAAMQWIVAAMIVNDRLFDLSTGSFWFPALATSFIAWAQAVMWSPVRHRFVRAMQLLVLLAVYLVVFALSLNGTLSGELILVLSLAQFPIAYAVGAHGVARCRRGEPSPVNTAASHQSGAMPSLASPFDAQLWIERHIHRWTGKSALVGLIPAALLVLVVVARLSGKHESDPEMLQILGKASIVLLFIALGVIGISTGCAFGTFRRRMPWHVADAYLVPPFFAALPLATSDFAWAKMRAAVQRTLWVSAGVVLICVLVARVSGFALTALPTIATVLLVLSATASSTSIMLLGRSTVVWIAFAIICLLPLFALRIVVRPDTFLAGLPVILPIAAAVKLGALAALIIYVSSRKLLSWGRLAIITGFWAATAGTVGAWLTSYAPQGFILHALCAGIVIAPVLGAVAAPAALAWNRAR
jgi:hypothetical protein